MLGIYCRISRDRKNQLSIHEQKQRGIEFANKNSVEFQVYIDKGISGGSKIEDRPEFSRLLNDITYGIVDSVYVYNQDRAERSEITWFNLANLVLENNIKLYENGILIDLDNPDVFMMHGFKTVLNSHYRRTTSKKIKDVLKRKASEGKSHGTIAYGYTKDEKGFLVPDEEESKIIKRIFKDSYSGKGVKVIADELNRDNVPTRYNLVGKKELYTFKDRISNKVRTRKASETLWRANTVRGIILNPIYKGERQYHNQTFNVPSIISEVQWDKVNEAFKKNVNNKGKKTTYNYLLRGKLICGVCGSNYYGRQRKNKSDNYYMCSSRRYKEKTCKNKGINIDVLEGFIWQRFFADKIFIELVKNHNSNNDIDNKTSNLRLKLDELEKCIESNNKMQQKAVKLVLNGVLSEEDVKSEMLHLKNEKRKYQIDFSNLKEELDSLLKFKYKADEIIGDLKKIKANSSFIKKKEIIDKYLNEVKILYKKNYCYLDIRFNIPDMVNEQYLMFKNRAGKYIASIELKKKILIPLMKDILEFDKEDLINEAKEFSIKLKMEAQNLS